MFLLIGIVAVVIVVLLTSRWWADGLISGTEFFFLTIVYGGLGFGFFALITRKEFSAAIFVMIAIATSVGWALYCNKKLGIKQYYLDKIKDYEKAIQVDPNNMAARSMLADAYYMLGDLDQAIAAMELIVQMWPNAMEESHKLRQWRSERDLRDSRTIVCPICNARNLWGSKTCRTCLQPLVYSRSAGSSFTEGLSKYGWHIALIACWLIVTIISFIALRPVLGAAVSGCSALAVVGMMLLSSAKK